MKRKERLIATLKGQPVDRPAVSFYEINGLDEKINDPDPFNIYNDSSWIPLIELAREKTDRIVMRSVPFDDDQVSPIDELSKIETTFEGGHRIQRTTIKAGKNNLTAVTRRDSDVNTVWQIEHLLKNLDDLIAFIEIPRPFPVGKPDISGVLRAEAELGDTGIVMIDTPDPLCMAASLFDLGTFSILATQEQVWFQRLLELFAIELYYKVNVISQALPHHLWRIYGPEYASPPYLSPKLFHKYVTSFDSEIVKLIHEHNGYARIHSHGNLRAILDEIVATDCDGLDPIEPPPQGDISLKEVKQRIGNKVVLFGNLEASDLEILPTEIFSQRILQALKEGCEGEGRGFVLMPSSCPYGRELPIQALRNYERMVDLVENWK